MPGVGTGRGRLTRALSMLLGVVLGAALLPAASAGSPTEYDPACPPAAAPAPESDPTRILLAGDSITNGTSGDYTWRYFLYRYLVGSGENVDFVGPWSDLIDNITYQWGHHEYAACDFDQDHLARGGGQLAEQLEPAIYSPTGASKINWATSYYDPDVVIQFFGYNDLSKPRVRNDPDSAPYTVAELLANAGRFVEEVRAAKPDAAIVMVNLAVAEIPGGPAENKRLVELAPTYNAQLAQAVTSWSTPASPVVLGDAARYWRGYPDTYDGAHPNAQGEVALAAGIARSLSLGLGLGSVPSLPLPTMALGPRTAPVLRGEVGTLGSVGAGTVRLSWDVVPGATRMLVFCRPAGTSTWNALPEVARTLDEAGNSVTLRTCQQATPPATDPPLVPGSSYQFQIRAAKGTAVATDLASNVVTLTQPGTAPLGQVPGLTVTPAEKALQVAWGAVPGASDYVVGWRRAGATAYTSLASAARSVTLTGLEPGQRYEVRVRARGSGTDGPYAGPLSGTPTAPPVEPVVLTAPIKPTLVKVSGPRIRNYWKAVPAATFYEVEYRSSGGTWSRMGWSTKTSLTSPRLVPGRWYAFRVRAWNADGPGPYSPPRPIKAG